MHAAAEWFLRRVGRAEELVAINQQFPTGKPLGDRRWYVAADGTPMAIMPTPQRFHMGSPPGPPRFYREIEAPRHLRVIDRRFAIAASEVTFQQFQKFANVDLGADKMFAPDEDSPQIKVNWYDAVKYCRWLSELENIADDQMCYPPIDEIKEGMTLSENMLQCTGYRLPTEAEWEFACRGGTSTPWHFGYADALFPHYARFLVEEPTKTLPVRQRKPNGYGLFDMHGNVWEWTQSLYQKYPQDPPPGGVSDVLLRAGGETRRVLRGGSFADLESRSALRNPFNPKRRGHGVGFRIARTHLK